MSAVWLRGARLAERRRVATGPLVPLASSLAADLEPVLARDLWLPPEKARLSRDGGRCPADGSYLRFDPFTPRRHECPRCGRAYDDEAHYRWWIMGYHLWLAERAVHAALLHALVGDVCHRAFAEQVMRAYCDAYPRYPNRDNVLGPSRPFFSTYLESIWLLQLCVALDILESTGTSGAAGDELRERVIEPSESLIASFDEGDSNRQVWNNAALLAARTLLGREEATEEVVWGASGVANHLSRALLADGSWYEGENYHLFAHRGLWYGVELAEAAGQGPLPETLTRRFDQGFVTPFLTVLPDFTFPARRDSQYDVSLRQWRFAELAELGLARMPGDRRLHRAVARLYSPHAREGDSGRWRSTAEAERNEAPVRLTRADLGWRSLLAALPELPPLRPAAPGSVLLDAQGLAVFRRDRGRVYAALDYGESGGGHGHPDRLNVLLSVGEDRRLDDPGTGSYVDPSLHWYRATLAHHAPLVGGRDQWRASGELRAFEERGGVGWVDATVADVAPGIELRRAIVMMPGYLVDELSWTAHGDASVALPVHGGLELDVPGSWVSDSLEVDGASYLSAVERLDASVMGAVALRRPGGGAPLAWYQADDSAEWWRAEAPGAPGMPRARMHLVRLHGSHGRLRAVWPWDDTVCNVAADGDMLRVLTPGGDEHLHGRSDDGWLVVLGARGARSSILLGGALDTGPRGAAAPARGRTGPPHPAELPSGTRLPPPIALPARFILCEPHYRRSEQSWSEAGSPGASVELEVQGADIVVRVGVTGTDLVMVPPGAVNDMDNERAEINGDGVQIYLGVESDEGGGVADAGGAPATGARIAGVPTDGDWLAGWLVLPRARAAARVVPLDPRAAALPLRAVWGATEGGYMVEARLPLTALDSAGRSAVLLADVLVNETAPGRERRRGQLVMSGARGEYVYLRGDRHDAGRCLRFTPSR